MTDEVEPKQQAKITMSEAIVIALLSAVFAVLGTTVTAYFGYLSKGDELKVHLVEIAVGILRADPKKEDIAPARSWAIDVMEKYSDVKLSAEDRKNLEHKQLQYESFKGALFGRGIYFSECPSDESLNCKSIFNDMKPLK